jgi:DNA-binding CsgD family transcriptional regulator
VVAEGQGQHALGVRQVADDYAHEFFTRDENLVALRAELTGGRAIASRHVHRECISDAGYRERFYDSVDIEGKFSFLARANIGSVYVNLYRAPRQGAFRVDEVDVLRHSCTLFASALRKHLIMMPPYVEPRCKDSRLQRVHQLLGMGRGAQLTAREAEVCAHVVLGYSTTAIASLLGITEGTVATLRKRAYARIGIASQNELFALCLDNVGH